MCCKLFSFIHTFFSTFNHELDFHSHKKRFSTTRQHYPIVAECRSITTASGKGQTPTTHIVCDPACFSYPEQTQRTIADERFPSLPSNSLQVSDRHKFLVSPEALDLAKLNLAYFLSRRHKARKVKEINVMKVCWLLKRRQGHAGWRDIDRCMNAL